MTINHDVDVSKAREKYKVLYEYFKLQFEDAKGQYFKLEDKSSKYLTFLNIFIPLYIFGFTFVLSKIPEINQLLLLSLSLSIICSFLCFCSSWSFIFRSLKMMTIPKMPADREVVEFFHTHENLESIYCFQVNLYREGILLYNDVNDNKIRLINIAYKEIAFGSWSFMLSICLLLAINWIYL
ncbi:hypothetical protein [Acinetobacter rongchengensis]|uniref:Uncharacterized protein n=1 Tax=Acinetobacter rongchengensis TaxID=2419601 RepID=A0A3A8F6E5_9GAMM|nr:hypothetical protein [Acinetobacter rongchengensis]RKG36721.1 hypothetical protein D7V20_13795 [Acinetobacter rongchengensis]